MRRPALRTALATLLALALTACGSGPRRSLQPAPLPDLNRLDQSVQAQIRASHDALEARLDNRRTADADLGAAFGEYGMLLHAAEYLDAAEPAYLDAQQLMASDARWPYYLGLLYRARGDTPRALAALTRALALAPDDVPTLVWLGRTYLERGDAAQAEPLFAHANVAAPGTIAVLAGLGQSALARRDYGRAAMVLEEALSIAPGVASLNSPLAQAYRGLGDTKKAELYLARWRNTEVPLADPRRQALDLLLDSGLSYELRGTRALEAHDFVEAARLFRKGIALAPDSTQLGRSLRHKLGTALVLHGDTAAAVEQFELVTAAAPAGTDDEPAAKAYYSLGVLAASDGRTADAIHHFTAAVHENPAYVEAFFALGETLRQAGRYDASLTPYAEAVRLDPRAADARLAYALSLGHLQRYREARDWLVESTRTQPDRPELAQALARLYAAAPDARVRNGQKAFAITQQLLATQPKTTPLGEVMAMTAAELGNFDEAIAIQRDILEAARRAGLDGDIGRMSANLQRYERGQPCRTPWPDDAGSLAAVFSAAPPR
jgi:tetratricopeptide (TPR) repeat protein